LELFHRPGEGADAGQDDRVEPLQVVRAMDPARRRPQVLQGQFDAPEVAHPVVDDPDEGPVHPASEPLVLSVPDAGASAVASARPVALKRTSAPWWLLRQRSRSRCAVIPAAKKKLRMNSSTSSTGKSPQVGVGYSAAI